MKRRGVLRALSLVVVLGLAVSPTWANGLFLTIPSIPGESEDPTFADQIDLLVLLDVAEALQRDGCAGPATLAPITLRKREDVASPKLFEAVANATNLGTVTISSQPASGDYVEIEYSLSDTVVTTGAVTLEMPANSLLETWELRFSAMQVTYRESAAATPLVLTFSAAQCR